MSLRKSPTRTPAFLAADRANAQKCTGPRTPEGKTRLALNALRHGLKARTFFSHLAKSCRAPEEFELSHGWTSGRDSNRSGELPALPAAWCRAKLQQNDFFGGTKLPISLKTKSRVGTDRGTKLPFRRLRTDRNLGLDAKIWLCNSCVRRGKQHGSISKK